MNFRLGEYTGTLISRNDDKLQKSKGHSTKVKRSQRMNNNNGRTHLEIAWRGPYLHAYHIVIGLHIFLFA